MIITLLSWIKRQLLNKKNLVTFYNNLKNLLIHLSKFKMAPTSYSFTFSCGVCCSGGFRKSCSTNSYCTSSSSSSSSTSSECSSGRSSTSCDAGQGSSTRSSSNWSRCKWGSLCFTCCTVSRKEGLLARASGNVYWPNSTSSNARSLLCLTTIFVPVPIRSTDLQKKFQVLARLKILLQERWKKLLKLSFKLSRRISDCATDTNTSYLNILFWTEVIFSLLEGDSPLKLCITTWLVGSSSQLGHSQYGSPVSHPNLHSA